MSDINNITRIKDHYSAFRKRLFKSGFNFRKKQKKISIDREDLGTVKAYAGFINSYLQELGTDNITCQKILDYFELNPILFENCTFESDDTINFFPVFSNIERLPESRRIKEINIIFAFFLSQLHKIYSGSISPARSEEAFKESYQDLKTSFGNSPLIFNVLRNLPKGIMEEERIGLLPRDELEIRVHERTKKLSEANIALQVEIKERLKMQKVLEQKAIELAGSNNGLEQFFYIASHHLQEPVRSITSYSQLFMRRYSGQIDKDADTYLEYITEGASRLGNMIDDVYNISRVHNSGSVLTRVNCSTMMEDIVLQMKTTPHENMPIILYESLPTVMADERQLRQVFKQLIDNAVKYCTENQPEIHIDAESRENEYSFRVRDNGIGISSEYFERIFILFERLHNRKQYQGTGAGLALCKKIIERHGGHIYVESDGEHKGSTFCFNLPKRESDE